MVGVRKVRGLLDHLRLIQAKLLIKGPGKLDIRVHRLSVGVANKLLKVPHYHVHLSFKLLMLLLVEVVLLLVGSRGLQLALLVHLVELLLGFIPLGVLLRDELVHFKQLVLTE